MLLSTVVSDIEGTLISDSTFYTLDYGTAKQATPFLTFATRKQFIKVMVENPNISCIICTDEIAKELPTNRFGVFVSDYPKATFHDIHNKLADNKEYRLNDFENVIGEKCKISKLASIAGKNIRIGNNVTICDFAVINEHTYIGDNCYIGSGTVIGERSFIFAKNRDSVVPITDLGSVVIEDNVEIFNNCNIARATLPHEETRIGSFSKIDALCHIAHGVKIKKRVLIPAGAIIAGNSIISDDAWVGINATVSNRINIGKNSRVSLGSVVTKDVKDGETVSGNFAIEHKKFIGNLKKSVVEEIE